MSDLDRPTLPVATRAPAASGGLYFIVVAVVLAVLLGDYLVLGTPGLHWPVASASGQRVDVAAEQPRTATRPPPLPLARAYCRSTRVRSTNQLCGETKPFTFLLKARGFRSCTMNSQGGLSTRRSCAAV